MMSKNAWLGSAMRFLSRFPASPTWCNRDRIVLCGILTVVLLYLGARRALDAFLTTPAYFQARVTGLGSTTSQLWEMHSDYYNYGESPLLQGRHQACEGFFSMWPSDCVDKREDLHEKLRVLSPQMSAMNTTLTLYVTGMQGCHFDYPSIEVEQFNATELLTKSGFASTFPKINTWVKTRYTRISDILRICMAYQTGKAYTDMDVTYLELNKRLYERSYVGAALWSNAKNAIEITNGAFCLSKRVLSDMMAFQKSRILKGGDEYFYTELGPSMFHNVLMNRHDIVMYSQNAPAEPNLDAIARAVHHFGHKQLHLTGHVRKGNKNLPFGELVNKIRLKCGLSALSYPPHQV